MRVSFAFKIQSLVICLTLPLCGFGQKYSPPSSDPTDSTALVAIPRWVHWHAIHEIKVGRALDTAYRSLQAVNANNKQRLANADSVIAYKDSIAVSWRRADSVSIKRLEGNDEIIRDLKKRNKELKLWAIGTPVVTVILVLLLL